MTKTVSRPQSFELRGPLVSSRRTANCANRLRDLAVHSSSGSISVTSAGAPTDNVPALSFKNFAGSTVNISIKRLMSIVPFVNEEIDEQSEFGFEPDDSKRRLVELDFLFKPGVRRMIAAQNRERSVGDPFEDCFDVRFRAERRIHFAIGVEILDRLVRQRDVMRTNFAADLHSARSRFANQPNTAGGTDMLAMNVMIASSASKMLRITIASSPAAGQPGNPSNVLQ